MNSTIDRELFKRHAYELADSAADVIAEEIMRNFDRLTIDERLSLSGNERAEYFRLAKTLLCATCLEKIEREFSSESILPAIKHVKRILKNRM